MHICLLIIFQGSTIQRILSQNLKYGLICSCLQYFTIKLDMNLLGKKDSKTATKQIVPPAKVENPPPAPVNQNSDFKATLNDWISSTKSCLSSWKAIPSELCDSPFMKEVAASRKQFSIDFCHPLADFYRSLPLDITNWKFGFISSYSSNERLLGLQGLTLLTAISTLKVKNNVGFSRRFLFSIRNSAVTFLIGGLLIAPQIYNPLIKSDF